VLLHLAASLLQLRGNRRSTSPLVDSQGNVLCFNGEVFAGLDIAPGGNDGKALLEALQQAAADLAAAGATAACSSTQLPPSTPSAHAGSSGRCSSCSSAAGSSRSCGIMQVLSKLRGPWSLLYWQQQEQTLWFGRDVMGELMQPA